MPQRWTRSDQQLYFYFRQIFLFLIYFSFFHVSFFLTNSSPPPPPSPLPPLLCLPFSCVLFSFFRSVCAITAAMPGGTGLDKFGRRFPKRTFDVGIAEQHAITFAAGMAVEGLKPFAAIYSTFMQRAYEQIIHDVALQQLPVRMVLDRAGLVGNDGATHHGSFDLAYLGCVPDIVIMAPADEVRTLFCTLFCTLLFDVTVLFVECSYFILCFH